MTAVQKFRAPLVPEKFKEANRQFAQGLKAHPVTGEGLPALGTNVLTNVLNEAGAIPPVILRRDDLRVLLK